MSELGPIGRLGRWTATRFWTVLGAWAVLAVFLGVLSPRVEHALSGAGWEASGSESVAAREAIDRDFGGNSSSALVVAIHSSGERFGASGFTATITRAQRLLASDPAVRAVVPPRPGTSVAPDGRTAFIVARAAEDPNEMVRAADRLKADLSALGTSEIAVNLTGSSGMWSDFNQANKDAMLRSEVVSWPVTLAVLLVAFGSLVAAGLPLMLTVVGLISAAGMLYLGTQLFDISIWAMNFALMFALALGIDYALFIAMRFRSAHLREGLSAVEAVAVAMDTAGKAVLFSGLTVLVALSAVLLVPSPAFRSMALGIMLAVTFVLVAALTLLPAILARLGPRINRLALPGLRPHEGRSERSARWAERLWRRPLPYGLVAVVLLGALAWPVLGLKTSMPSIGVVPVDDSSRQGQQQLTAAFGPGIAAQLQVVAAKDQRKETIKVLRSYPSVAEVLPPQESRDGRGVYVTAIPSRSPSSDALDDTIEGLRDRLPAGTLLGGSVAESHDLEAELDSVTPVVIGIVLGLGFVLLLLAVQAPMLAAAGVLSNLLATGAAFGIAKWIFQDGALASVIGFEPQGFVDAWAPVFFFAMVFALSMDYTVFLFASAKEHWERSADPREALVGGMADSGRVILAAAVVMVAVFFTFALSGPLPPKEMGIILGVAVLLDATLVRLLLMPVIFRLLGRSAWWLPHWIDRILPDVHFGHGDAADEPASRATG